MIVLHPIAGARARRIVRRAMIAVLASASLAACTGYHAQPTPGPSANTLVAHRARVTSVGGATVEVVNTIVRGDSLHGTLRRPGGAPISIALNDVRSFEVREPKHALTTALVLFGTAFATAFGLAIAFDIHNT